ncbi:MAG TPA: hypothetical protein VJ917_09500 [Saprospiraceae bacterium]|nr:hypothetical protein [Saprospiraceae bacterium]
MRNGYFLFSMLLLTFACNQNTNPFEKGVKMSDQKGHSYNIKTEQAEGQKIDILVETEGFKKNLTHRFNITDVIDTVLFADLDSNKLKELYIFTKSATRKPLTSVLGVASLQGYEAKPINAPDLSFRSEARGGFYEGFDAPNVYRFENGKLCEHFSIAQNNHLRTRGIDSARVCLELYQHEGQWVLNPYEQVHFRE